jgi:release factor glutamine methyltransferase
VAVTLAKLRPNARVLATDLSGAALEVLTRNALRHGVTNLESARGSWFETIGEHQFDVIVSNPPYVAADDPHLDRGDLRFEPRLALAAGPDGLSALREIAAGSPARLRPGGWLLLEHGYDQAEAVAGLVAAAGFKEYFLRRDLGGIPRVAQARLP